MTFKTPYIQFLRLLISGLFFGLGCAQCQYPQERLFIGLKAGFVVDTLGQVDTPIKFYEQSTKMAADFFWDFGDGTTSQEKNPVHHYTKSGVYTVRLVNTKNNSNVTDTLSRRLRIIPKVVPLSGTQERFFGNHQEEIGFTMTPTERGGYLLAGRRNFSKLHLTRIGPNLYEMWSRTIDLGNALLVVTKIIALSDASGYVIVGHQQDAPTRQNAFILKVNLEGALVWSNGLYSQEDDERYKGVVEVGGDLLVLSNIGGTSFIDTYTANGVFKSRHLIETINSGAFDGESLTLTSDTELLLGGSLAEQPIVLKLDLRLNTVSEKIIRLLTKKGDVCLKGKVVQARELSDKNIALISRVTLDTLSVCSNDLGLTAAEKKNLLDVIKLLGFQGPSSTYVAKVGSGLVGTINFTLLSGNFSDDLLTDFTEMDDGSLIVVGSNRSPFSGQDMLYVRLARDFMLREVRLIGTNYNESTRSIIYEPAKRRVLLFGDRDLGNINRSDFYLGVLDF